MNVWEKIKKVVRKLFRKNNIEAAFGTSIAVSTRMESKMQLWSDMFEDHPPWKNEEKGALTMNLPSAISSEMARLVTLEMQTEITGSERADWLNKQYQPVVKKARQFTDFACAMGGVVLKPYVSGDRIFVSVIQAIDFYPTSFDSDGDVTGGIFADYAYIGNHKYTRLEEHKLQNNTLTITNKVYKTVVSEISSTQENVLGNETLLTEVPEWAEIDPVVTINDVERTLFQYFKMPFANSVEPRSPLGVSVFAKAEEQIKEADRQWSESMWEFEAGEMAIHASYNLFRLDEQGHPIFPKGKERLYRTLEYNREEKFDPYNPQFRDQSLFNGLNKIVQRIEFLCGLAYGTISEPASVDKTATEVKQSRQRSFSTVVDIQKALQDTLDHLVYAMDVLATLYDLAPEGKYEISYYWDDSLVVDSGEQRMIDLQEVAAGIMEAWEYRMKWYNEDEETAKERTGFNEEKDDDEIMEFIDEPEPEDGSQNPKEKQGGE